MLRLSSDASKEHTRLCGANTSHSFNLPANSCSTPSRGINLALLRKSSIWRYFQCCVIFQAALLGLLQPGQHVDCQRTDQHVRTPDAQLGGGSPTTSIIGEENLLTDRGPEQKTQAGEESRSSWAQETGGYGRDHHFDGTNRHPARGSARAESDGQGLHPVHGTDWPNGSVIKSLPGRSGMEPKARRPRSGKQTAAVENDAADADGHGTCGSTGKATGFKEDKIKCRQQGWLNEDDLMLFQAWDPEKKRLTASTDLEPMTIEAVLKTLRDIIPLISPDHVLKFHAQRPLKGMSEAENKAVFNLEISLRAPAAHQLYGHVMRLAGSSCWQIIGTQVRRDTQRRSGAVQALQRLAYGTPGGLNQSSMQFNNSC